MAPDAINYGVQWLHGHCHFEGFCLGIRLLCFVNFDLKLKLKFKVVFDNYLISIFEMNFKYNLN